MLVIGDVMRKFIVSDLHGDGFMYDMIMKYLDHIGEKEEVTLYINGDLIDRGYGCFRMLIDVMERKYHKKGNINVEYLAGNHELLLYQAHLRRNKDGSFPKFSDWYLNGGKKLGIVIEQLSSDEQSQIITFISNLKIYNKFPEKIQGRNVLLVHAAAPKIVKDKCDLTIQDNNKEVFKALWTRKDDRKVFPPRIGNNDYFTIIGHTPIRDDCGFYFDKKENYLNIDGGCSGYLLNKKNYDHVPLVEVLNDSLKISVFKHDGTIYNVYDFDGLDKPKVR